MSAVAAKAVRATLRRWDQKALEQLCAEVARLSVENEQLRVQLDTETARANQAEDWCEDWRADAMSMQQALCELSGGRPGIRTNGALVIVSGGER